MHASLWDCATVSLDLLRATDGGGANLRFGVVEGELSCGASVCACAAVREGEDGTGACMTRVGDGEAGGVR